MSQIAEENNNEHEIDYLEVDKPIPGQNFVCISFVSPEKVIKDRNLSYVKKFLNIYSEKMGISIDNIEKEYEDFLYKNEENMEREFNEENDNITSTRGIKIRGSYSTKREADIRAQVLQRLDKNFHVYVGQVGYWLPWDPNPDRIADNQYMEKELQNLVKSYNENQMEKQIFYKDQVSERKDNIIKENLKKKESLSEKNINGENEKKIIDNLMNTESHQNLKEDFSDYKKEIKEI
jgi:hypothetical protein